MIPQSGVGRHICKLEDELEAEIFICCGNRLISMTNPGKTPPSIAERILNEINNVSRITDLFANKNSGELFIITIHTWACD